MFFHESPLSGAGNPYRKWYFMESNNSLVPPWREHSKVQGVRAARKSMLLGLFDGLAWVPCSLVLVSKSFVLTKGGWLFPASILY